MTRLGLSTAAIGLLRALIQRAATPSDRILLTGWRSTDWQSLTFDGERHEAELRICGPEAAGPCARLTEGLADAEFSIPGQIVADIAVINVAAPADDGSISVKLEALTVAE